MSILGRYIFREMVDIFPVALGFFTFVLVLQKVLYLTDLMVKGVPPGVTLLLLLYLFPSMLAIAIPISVLASSIMAFSRLSADSEIVALKACGMSVLRLVWPVMIFSFIAYLASTYLMFSILPRSNTNFKRTVFEIVQSKVALKLREGTFIRDFDGLVIFISHIPSDRSTLEGVMITDQRREDFPQTIFAQEGRVINDPQAMKVTMSLRNGTIHREMGERYEILQFDRNHISIDFGKTLEKSKKALKGHREMTLKEMKERLEVLQAGTVPHNALLVEIQKKFAAPFACLIMGLIGAPLGVTNRRAGRAGGFVITIIVTLLYYVLFTFGEGLGDQGRLEPRVAMWAPNIAFGALGILLIVKVNRESPFRIVEWCRAVSVRIGGRGEAR